MQKPLEKPSVFPTNPTKICEFLGGQMNEGICDAIPKYNRSDADLKGDMGNLIGIIRLQATEPLSLKPHPSIYRRDQYIALVYPFRGATWQEPAADLTSYRMLPVTKRVAEQYAGRDNDTTLIPISMHGNVLIEAGGFHNNSGERLDEYLSNINKHNHPYKAGSSIRML